MIIAISGSPGTGKSKAAEILAKELNANLIDIKQLIEKHKVPCKPDRKRKTKIVDPRDLQKAVNREARKGTNIVDGVLAHLLKADFVIILRTRPDILEKRLKKRGWRREKIRENIEAEVLDEITIEAMDKYRKVYEIDTTNRTAKATARMITKLLNRYALNYRRKYRAGHIDWSERYKHYLW